MTNPIGQSFGRYHILEQLGEGGMATVYKAYDTRLETDVAVKVIRTENLIPSTLERSLKRFEREAKSLAKLTHANIVNISDYGEYDGKPYLVMPYLPGGTLKQKLKGEPIQYQEAARLLIPIARALAYAHEQGIVHRDIKPANILITHSGDPMLTDFGIAKIIDDEATMDLTGTSAAVGTPEYMAPEQITSKTVDHRADIYALGIVFYEMVTGRKPFQADTPMAVLFKHASEPLPRPKTFTASVPEEVEKILFKALAKKPENRYPDMNAFATALDGLLRNTRQAGREKSPVKRPVNEINGNTQTARKPMANPVLFISSQIRKFFPLKINKTSLVWGLPLTGIALIILLAVVLVPKIIQPQTYYTTLNSNRAGIYYFLDSKNSPIFKSSGTAENWHPAPDKLGNLYFSSFAGKTQVEVFVLNADGTKSQFTHTPAPYSSWTPAPDLWGNLFFTSNQRDGKAEIYVIDSKGNKSQLTHTPGKYESWSPAPDGLGNTYFVSNQDGNAEIFVIDGKGKKTQVTHTPGKYESWSPAPDGLGNVYFVSNQDGNPEIFVIDTKGKKIQVTHTSGNHTQNWSPVPDGLGNLYFTSNRNGKSGIFMMNTKGETQVLTGIPSNSWLKERSGEPSRSKNTQ